MLVLNASDGSMVSFLNVANAKNMDMSDVDSMEMAIMEMSTDNPNDNANGEISPLLSTSVMIATVDPQQRHDTQLHASQYPITDPLNESSFLTQEDSTPAQNNVTALSQCFHKIMWCEREHKVAVRQGEQTIITSNVTLGLVPTGSVIINTEH